eukprot:gene13069-8915_t
MESSHANQATPTNLPKDSIIALKHCEHATPFPRNPDTHIPMSQLSLSQLLSTTPPSPSADEKSVSLKSRIYGYNLQNPKHAHNPSYPSKTLRAPNLYSGPPFTPQNYYNTPPALVLNHLIHKPSTHLNHRKLVITTDNLANMQTPKAPNCVYHSQLTTVLQQPIYNPYYRRSQEYVTVDSTLQAQSARYHGQIESKQITNTTKPTVLIHIIKTHSYKHHPHPNQVTTKPIKCQNPKNAHIKQLTTRLNIHQLRARNLCTQRPPVKDSLTPKTSTGSKSEHTTRKQKYHPKTYTNQYEIVQSGNPTEAHRLKSSHPSAHPTTSTNTQQPRTRFLYAAPTRNLGYLPPFPEHSQTPKSAHITRKQECTQKDYANQDKIAQICQTLPVPQPNPTHLTTTQPCPETLDNTLYYTNLHPTKLSWQVDPTHSQPKPTHRIHTHRLGSKATRNPKPQNHDLNKVTSGDTTPACHASTATIATTQPTKDLRHPQYTQNTITRLNPNLLPTKPKLKTNTLQTPTTHQRTSTKNLRVQSITLCTTIKTTQNQTYESVRNLATNNATLYQPDRLNAKHSVNPTHTHKCHNT